MGGSPLLNGGTRWKDGRLACPAASTVTPPTVETLDDLGPVAGKVLAVQVDEEPERQLGRETDLALPVEEHHAAVGAVHLVGWLVDEQMRPRPRKTNESCTRHCSRTDSSTPSRFPSAS
jgi:hypothetical protein